MLHNRRKAEIEIISSIKHHSQHLYQTSDESHQHIPLLLAYLLDKISGVVDAYKE